MGGGSPLYPSHLPLSPLQHGAVAVLSSIGALLRHVQLHTMVSCAELMQAAESRPRSSCWRDHRPIRSEAPACSYEARCSGTEDTGRTTAHHGKAVSTWLQVLVDAELYIGSRTPAPAIVGAFQATHLVAPTPSSWAAEASMLTTAPLSGASARATVCFMQAGEGSVHDSNDRFVQDEELAYVLTRMREVHDFWHVLFDCHTNVFGELALKAVEFVQTGVPMTGLAVLGAQYRLKPADRQLLQETFLPWAVRAGTRSRDLMNIYYEENFQEDLEDMRRRYNILPAPPVPLHLAKKRAATEVHSA
ncbi:hypothetical protein QJQ45_030007 [Haematococcus lacustris]|nr:hypothetical protein QJQ45_030007 [Haematococcus lacustris]